MKTCEICEKILEFSVEFTLFKLILWILTEMSTRIITINFTIQ